MNTGREHLFFQLRIERILWEKFKAKVPRTITLNDALLDLIKKEVG
ncbi:MAG TPA: hypothetical protein VJP79_02180 [Nitrososphaera sp.]|nr:hypothetical protein [Nitrososphaera sp.]